MKIDYQDHWAFADHSISVYNFPRFEAEEWRRWNPTQSFQNRLRHSDYRRLFQTAGLSILEDEAIIPDGGLEKIEASPLATSFRSYPAEELAAIAGWFVLTVQR